MINMLFRFWPNSSRESMLIEMGNENVDSKTNKMIFSFPNINLEMKDFYSSHNFKCVCLIISDGSPASSQMQRSNNSKRSLSADPNSQKIYDSGVFCYDLFLEMLWLTKDVYPKIYIMRNLLGILERINSW